MEYPNYTGYGFLYDFFVNFLGLDNLENLPQEFIYVTYIIIVCFICVMAYNLVHFVLSFFSRRH